MGMDDLRAVLGALVNLGGVPHNRDSVRRRIDSLEVEGEYRRRSAEVDRGVEDLVPQRWNLPCVACEVLPVFVTIEPARRVGVEVCRLIGKECDIPRRIALFEVWIRSCGFEGINSSRTATSSPSDSCWCGVGFHRLRPFAAPRTMIHHRIVCRFQFRGISERPPRRARALRGDALGTDQEHLPSNYHAMSVDSE